MIQTNIGEAWKLTLKLILRQAENPDTKCWLLLFHNPALSVTIDLPGSRFIDGPFRSATLYPIRHICHAIRYSPP